MKTIKKITKMSFITVSTTALLVLLGFVSLGGIGLAYAPDVAVIEVIDPFGKTVDGLTQRQRAAKIDAYFAQWNLPLAGYGMVFVQEADKYDNIDWRLLPAIAMRESTGGKFAFAKNNYFGWGRQVEFASVSDAIASVTKHLAGENESTSYHYAGKDTEGILAKYNSVIPDYTDDIFFIMSEIESMDSYMYYNHLAINQ